MPVSIMQKRKALPHSDVRQGLKKEKTVDFETEPVTPSRVGQTPETRPDRE